MGLKNTYQARKKFTKVPVDKTGMWYQDKDVVVPSNQITMKGPNGESNYFDSPIMGIGMQSGQKQIMQPGKEYSFPNDNSVYERKMQKGAEVALDAASFLPPPFGTAAGLGSAAINIGQRDWEGLGWDLAGIASGGAAKIFKGASKAAKVSGAGRVARSMDDKAKFFNVASNPNIYKTIGLGRDYNPINNQTGFGVYQDNTRVAPTVRPVKPRMQEGGSLDPEFMFKNKYNTELTPTEEANFYRWAIKESKRQNRDILQDMGAYDVKGFWKSGDYKMIDSDNHGADTWKKPNHPTFSNQSRYHGADGWYGGNWTDKAGYQPSKQTLETYGPDYYNWMFKSEPGRSEYLDMSRYESGTNAPTPFVYQIGGHVIRPGDTFYGIANSYGIPKQQLQEANPNIKIDLIKPGQKLKLPSRYEGDTLVPGYFETMDESSFNNKPIKSAQQPVSTPLATPTPAPVKAATNPSPGLTPQLLLKQAYAESTFNPKAVSPAGYMGLAQIGEEVITDYKKATGVKKVDPYNPEDNARVQQWAMNQIYNADFVNKEGQDPNVRLAKTLASYNWGKGNVLKHLKKQKAKGVDIYNSLDWVESLPKETRDYVHKIQVGDIDTFESAFNKAVKDKSNSTYINLYKQKYGGLKQSYLNTKKFK